jgi:hypothetical protein
MSIRPTTRGISDAQPAAAGLGHSGKPPAIDGGSSAGGMAAAGAAADRATNSPLRVAARRGRWPRTSWPATLGAATASLVVLALLPAVTLLWNWVEPRQQLADGPSPLDLTEVWPEPLELAEAGHVADLATLQQLAPGNEQRV